MSDPIVVQVTTPAPIQVTVGPTIDDAVQSDVVARIVVSENPDAVLEDGDLLVVVPPGTLGGDATSPSIPTDLVATATGASTVGLVWTASTDNVAVTGYEYRIDGGSAVDAGAGTTESVGGLSPSTLYSFEVRAYDAAGNRSGWSTADDATTDATDPFTTDFSGDTAEAPPSGWTSRWAAGTATVKADAGATGGKTLRLTNATGRSAWSFDAAGSAADVEILCRWKSVSGNSGGGRALVRGAGSGGAETGILGYLASTGVISAGKYIAGTAPSLGTGGNIGAPGVGVWHRTRLRVSGGTMTLRIWEEPTAEPGTWDITSTDLADILGAGWVGLMAFNAGSTDYDWVSVAVGGGTAPSVS